ncbi:MAG: DUF896 domain-containing protein [Oscillospiraceae bacterium]|nr:DUF896 domain-containing protein [Oscillospiraceae bacterium]MBR2635461.1 DUF896 domain-containing protein [Oscillospiraceae bacterium]
MEKKKLERIGELSRKERSGALLTAEEKAEQKALRQEYLDAIRQSLVGTLDNTYFVDEAGNKRKAGSKEKQ